MYASLTLFYIMYSENLGIKKQAGQNQLVRNTVGYEFLIYILLQTRLKAYALF